MSYIYKLVLKFFTWETYATMGVKSEAISMYQAMTIVILFLGVDSVLMYTFRKACDGEN